jgi:hypothetical protein
VSLFTSSGDSSNGWQTTLFSALIIFILYAVTFLRVVNLPQFPQVKRYYVTFMAIVVGIVALLGIIGPMAQAHKTKDDKLIENSLQDVNYAIEDYADSNSALPSSLDQISVNGDAADIVDRNLVDYTPNVKASTSKTSSYSGSSYTDVTYYYKLCVDYRDASDNSGYYHASEGSYSDYLSTTPHPAGKKCYNLKYTSYGTAETSPSSLQND